ncbi:GNAT family N-acetyltransferase [Defluviimonas sp. WL0050]|uniref:GNAT family N-acetyltransferase n=1 Tax=Albidovulum litorale TaxID=2984134 RepID=A0ABT2ZTC2_9RHOB|nr:GNAT family N-acetyltransferase [Defluviimonas sp. WL0050]MCV2874395.1 GNAT family N-acetyltransferase [Defluviimonas sp. WL0050]
MTARDRIAEDNYVATFAGMAGLLPGGVCDARDGALHIYSGAEIATFNPTILCGPDLDADRALDAAVAFYSRHGSPLWTVATRAADAPGVEPALRARGFSVDEEVPHMVLDRISPPVMPEGLEVEQVTDFAGLRCHFEVVAEAFGIPFSLFGPACDPALLDDRFGFFVGRWEGRPVATSLCAVSDGAGVRCAGIYNVCILEAHRGRGLGFAMTAYAAEAGRSGHGCEVAALQATEMGYPLYERMGYREVTCWRMWSPPK